MKLFNWKSGRSEATQSLKKLTLWMGKTFDIYLLKLPKNTDIGWHFDKVPDKEHHRINICLWGDYTFFGTNKPFTCNIPENRYTQWMGILSCHQFRPDLEEHAAMTHDGCYILSIGWIK